MKRIRKKEEVPKPTIIAVPISGTAEGRGFAAYLGGVARRTFFRIPFVGRLQIINVMHYTPNTHTHTHTRTQVHCTDTLWYYLCYRSVCFLYVILRRGPAKRAARKPARTPSVYRTNLHATIIRPGVSDPLDEYNVYTHNT